MNILAILTWLSNHWKAAINAICGASVAFLLAYGVFVHKQNLKLSESLEMAQNNIEAYLGLLDSSLLANNVLRLDFTELKYLNDKTLQKLDSIAKKNKIKAKTIKVAATQNQSIDVILSKGVGGDIITILKDTTYQDSIQYNNLTTVYYTIGKDTVSIGLHLENDLYLYIYDTKEYKNKKSFIKRLLTLDFKKVHKTIYYIENTNDIILSGEVRVVEAITK